MDTDFYKQYYKDIILVYNDIPTYEYLYTHKYLVFVIKGLSSGEHE